MEVIVSLVSQTVTAKIIFGPKNNNSDLMFTGLYQVKPVKKLNCPIADVIITSFPLVLRKMSSQ